MKQKEAEKPPNDTNFMTLSDPLVSNVCAGCKRP